MKQETKIKYEGLTFEVLYETSPKDESGYPATVCIFKVALSGQDISDFFFQGNYESDFEQLIKDQIFIY